jgi:hypothetical protein
MKTNMKTQMTKIKTNENQPRTFRTLLRIDTGQDGSVSDKDVS